MPAQQAANAVLVPVTVGTIHDPLTEVTEPEEPVTAHPLQFRLFTLLPLMSTTLILGAANEPERAKAGPNEANSISELTKSIDNFVAIFTIITPYYIRFARIKDLFRIRARQV